MDVLNKSVKTVLPLFVLISCISFVIYVVAQQVVRIGVNDKLNETSTELAFRLSNKEDISKYIPIKIELSKTDSNFVMVFDATGKIVSSSAVLNDDIPQIPAGVLDYAKTNKQDRITWQPKQSIREAIVVTYYSNSTDSGYVLAGRSLSEPEKLENSILMLVSIGWLGTMTLTFATVFVVSYKKKII